MHAGAEGGPLLDVIEGALQQLLEAGAEEAAFQALQANLEADAAPAGASAAGTPGSLVPITGGANGALAIAAFGSGAGGGGAAAALGDGRAQAAAAERCSLLNVLILIYYHPRKQCTPDRFLSLAKLFHARLFTRALPRAGGAAAGGLPAEPSPAQLSIKLVRSCVGWLASLGGWPCRPPKGDLKPSFSLPLPPSRTQLSPRPHPPCTAGHAAAAGDAGR